MGGGDTACAALAAGVTKEGEVCESVGTTGCPDNLCGGT